MTGVRDLWRRAQAVCFDVDSTVSPDEAIDVLAAHAGMGEAIAAMTRRAMGGAVRFEDALRERLDLLRPDRAMIDACLRAHPPRLTPGIAELVAALHGRGTHVHLVSGGFMPFIVPLAQRLGITAARVHANDFRFHADGAYAGHVVDRPTARSGGKATVMRQLKDLHGYQPLIMVGDGATDLEARPHADAVIGYGGVVVRAKVQAEADWFVSDFHELTAALS